MAAIHNYYLTHFYLDKPPAQLTDSEKLELIRKCKNFKEVKELLNKEEPNYYKELIETYEGAKSALKEDGDSNGWFWGEDDDLEEGCQHEQDLREFSKKYPNVVFELRMREYWEGAGEYDPYLWRKYFNDGKMQCCLMKISYDNFDIEKLK